MIIMIIIDVLDTLGIISHNSASQTKVLLKQTV